MLLASILRTKIDFGRTARFLTQGHLGARFNDRTQAQNQELRASATRSFLSTNDSLSPPKDFKNKCQSCRQPVHRYEVMCRSCGALTSAETSRCFDSNPWLAFKSTTERELDFDIDKEALHEEYRKKMKDLHPDKRSAEQLDLANQHSSMIKTAYDILSNPIRRAELICRLLYNLECFEENTNIDDDEFMMELLDANEYILEGLSPPAQRNYSKISPEILHFRSKWEEKYAEELSNLRGSFQQARTIAPEDRMELLQKIRSLVHACLAIKKLLEQLEARLLELGYDISE